MPEYPRTVTRDRLAELNAFTDRLFLRDSSFARLLLDNGPRGVRN
jgi:hypothetical protein